MSTVPFHTPEFLGFYLPPLLIWALMALVPYLVLRWVLTQIGFYRIVWHRPLFDVALYVILLSIAIFGLPAVKGGMGWL